MFIVLRDLTAPAPTPEWVDRVTKSYDIEADAVAEARRLAGMHGCPFYVMEAMAAFEPGEVKEVFHFQIEAERGIRLAHARGAEPAAVPDPPYTATGESGDLEALPF